MIVTRAAIGGSMLVLVACGATMPDAGEKVEPQPVRVPDGLVEAEPSPVEVEPAGAIDWCDVEVGPGFGRMKDCRAEIHEYAELGGRHDTHIWHAEHVLAGAIGDCKRDCAALVVRQENWLANGGGWSEVSVYVVQAVAGKPERRGELELGDVREVEARLADGRIEVRYVGHEGHCTDGLTFTRDAVERLEHSCASP